MKTVMKTGLLFVGLIFFGSVSAQSTGTQINSTSNSQVSSGAQSSAANLGNNQGQAITFNSPPTPTRTTSRIESAPSMGLGSFGTSFSTDNCSNTIAGQMSLIGIGASYGQAKIEENCAHLRRGYAFGQAAAFAAASKQHDVMLKEQAMVNFEFCMAGNDQQTIDGCIAMGLIKSNKTPDNKVAYSPAFKSVKEETAEVAAQRRADDVTQQQRALNDQSVVDEQAAHGPMVISPVRTGYNQSGVTGQ